MSHKTFHLGIDARMYGLKHAGIGRYVENLVNNLTHDPKINQLTLFMDPKVASNLQFPPHVQVIPTSIRHYSLSEQLLFMKLLQDHPVDLMHFPHFNVPILYNRPFIVTIHDILWHNVRGSSVTTLNPLLYYFKYLGYRLVVNQAVSASKAIIVPSNYVKNELKNTFTKINPDKIHVTYEGVNTNQSTAKIVNHKSYLLYIGSAYPHKNIPVIFPVLKKLGLILKIVSSRTVFLDKLKQKAILEGVGDRVEFLGFMPDEKVTGLLQSALALVHPSQSEGFGLTGLEAMAAGCPVIASQTASLPEIYDDAALYFNPLDASGLEKQIIQLRSDLALRTQLIKKGKERVKLFSWDQMTAATVSIYENCLSLRPGH